MQWELQGACRDLPDEVFYSSNTKDRALAMSTCWTCPVRSECRAGALQPINVSAVLRNVLKADLDEGEDLVPVMGVIRGGVDIGEW